MNRPQIAFLLVSRFIRALDRTEITYQLTGLRCGKSILVQPKVSMIITNGNLVIIKNCFGKKPMALKIS